MAVKDEKMVDADAEQIKQKKQKQKKKGQKGEEDKEADLSEEDLELKKNLELMLERAKDSDAGVQRTALEGITREIKYDQSCSWTHGVSGILYAATVVGRVMTLTVSQTSE